MKTICELSLCIYYLPMMVFTEKKNIIISYLHQELVLFALFYHSTFPGLALLRGKNQTGQLLMTLQYFWIRTHHTVLSTSGTGTLSLILFLHTNISEAIWANQPTFAWHCTVHSNQEDLSSVFRTFCLILILNLAKTLTLLRGNQVPYEHWTG